jgi:hypothetical protein
MNCSDARQQLAELVYGDLDDREATSIQDHLKVCPECRKEAMSLTRLRQTLDALPSPTVSVDVQRVLQTAASRQILRLRRWQRVAVTLSGLAAVLIVALFLRVELRVQGNEVSVRWGATAEPQPAAPSVKVDRPQVVPAANPDLDERLVLLTGLVHALADDQQMRHADRQQQFDDLAQRLEQLQAQDTVRWNETKRDLTALYVAHFGLTQKGTQP